MLYALGLENRIVGVTSNCNFPPQVKKKQKIGSFFLNLEKVVSLKPDLIVMHKEAQKKDVHRFRKFGLPVLTINPKSVKDVMNDLIRLGKLTRTQKQAKVIVAKMKQRVKKVEKRTKDFRPKITDVLKLWNPKQKQRKALVIVGFKPLVVAGGGTFIDDILKYAGVKNVAAKTRAAYPQYSFEKLVRENPQYMIIPKGTINKSRIMKDKRWRSLEAVRTGRILFINQDIISRPGPRVVEAIEKIANFVYN